MVQLGQAAAAAPHPPRPRPAKAAGIGPTFVASKTSPIAAGSIFPRSSPSELSSASPSTKNTAQDSAPAAGVAPCWPPPGQPAAGSLRPAAQSHRSVPGPTERKCRHHHLPAGEDAFALSTQVADYSQLRVASMPIHRPAGPACSVASALDAGQQVPLHARRLPARNPACRSASTPNSAQELLQTC